jgi:hypothetical protein
MKSFDDSTFERRGQRAAAAFSLAELLAALVIGSLVLVAVLTIYWRAEKATAAVLGRIDNARFPAEILQLIAEDLDKVVAVNPDESMADTKIVIENQLEELYQAAKMTITRTIYDSNDKPKELEEITWQTSYNFDSFEPGLVLYRSHRGLVLEDKLHDEARRAEEAPYTFIPVCEGVTYFKIEVPKDQPQAPNMWQEQEEEFLDSWSGPPPKGVLITISFGEAFKSVLGNMEVYEEDKYSRRIAVDRTRRIDFVVETRQFGDANQPGEPNEQDLQEIQEMLDESGSEENDAEIPEEGSVPGPTR